MLELFGFAWVTITFTCCVAAVSTRRSVLRWMKARTDRKRLDDTVEIVRRPMRKVATYAALVALAVPAGVLAGGTALPGPSGGFGGGTVGSAVVLTGDNAGGVGTLRIRPSDEDTQIVLCEASNNSSPEMCSSISHVNDTATSFMQMTTNGYMDSASAWTRFNTSAGTTGIYTQASTTNASNVIGQLLYSTNNTISGSALFGVTGAGTSTYTIGQNGTVTTDIRGPILNGGSATCNGISAGSICHNDPAVFYDSNSTYSMYLGSSAANSSTQIWEHTQGTAGQATTLFVTGTMASPTVVGGVGYYGSTYSDADYANDIGMLGVSKELSFIRTDNPAAGAVHTKWTDDASASATLAGNTLMSLDGAGNLFLNASATRSKGTITLAAGTGTATVASGSICVCTDTTAVAAVQCSVATTTLTINGTGTDVIAYHCL